MVNSLPQRLQQAWLELKKEEKQTEGSLNGIVLNNNNNSSLRHCTQLNYGGRKPSNTNQIKFISNLIHTVGC